MNRKVTMALATCLSTGLCVGVLALAYPGPGRARAQSPWPQTDVHQNKACDRNDNPLNCESCGTMGAIHGCESVLFAPWEIAYCFQSDGTQGKTCEATYFNCRARIVCATGKQDGTNNCGVYAHCK